MIKRNFIFILTLIMLGSTDLFAYEDQSIKKEVQAQGFMVGSDSDLGGTFFYIVDKTSGICLAAIYGTPGNGGSGGLAEVSCDKLRKIPTINSYLGPLPQPPAPQATPVPQMTSSPTEESTAPEVKAN